MTDLETLSLDDLDLLAVSQADTAMDVRAGFPFSRGLPGDTGIELGGGHTAVYFEIEPGNELGTHRDSAEEIVVCLEGDRVEARAGDATREIGAGDVAVIPPLAPHGFRNVGEDTVRFLGVFSDGTNVGEFDVPLEPLGERRVEV